MRSIGSNVTQFAICLCKKVKQIKNVIVKGFRSNIWRRTAGDFVQVANFRPLFVLVLQTSLCQRCRLCQRERERLGMGGWVEGVGRWVDGWVAKVDNGFG